MRTACLVCLVVLSFVGVGPSAAADEKGKFTVERLEYQGWKNNLRLHNGEAELIATLDVGPRVLSYRLAGAKNVFKEYPEQLGKSGEKDWQIRGGHRFWVAPEDTTRTYEADNGPARYEELGPGHVRLTSAAEPAFGVRKEIELWLSAKGSKVAVVQRLTNVGKEATELAPWGLSVMAAGGVEIIPLPPKKPHPSQTKAVPTAADFAPNVGMALWPFFDFKDPRWTFGSKYLLLRQDPKRGPTKLGLAHRQGWVGYLNRGTLFIKRFGYEAGKTYPDLGSNFETFSNEDMLEVEVLGPLVKLAPGGKVELSETWELFGDVSEVKDDADADKNVLPHVGKAP